MLDLDERRPSPDLLDYLDRRREMPPESPEEDRQLFFHLRRGLFVTPGAPSDFAPSHGVERRPPFVQKAMAHDYLPKSDDELGHRPSQFPLQDKHDRQYGLVPGSPITRFVRAGGLRCSTRRLSTLSLSVLTAMAGPTASRTQPMKGVCPASTRISRSSLGKNS